MSNKFVTCRICTGKLKLEISLGEMYVSDFIKDSGEAVSSQLDIGRCVDCDVLQLANEDVDLDFLYKDHYWYRSGLNASMINDLKDVARAAERFGLVEEDVVVDIGCNDGSLFDQYITDGLCMVGFDPAPNLFDSADNKCDVFINDYFGAASSFWVGEKAKIITSIAMFYDLPNPPSFVQEVSDILAEDGVWIIQFTDLFSMLKINAIDNICAEHLEYYKLLDIMSLVMMFDMEVFDVEYNKVNGGSIRIFVGFKDKHPISSNVLKAVVQEGKYLAKDNLFKLVWRVKKFSTRIRKAIVETDGLVCGMAASTKGNTLLQILELDSTDITAIGEINKDKFGLMTSGTNIPIIPEKEVFNLNPGLIIVLAWHFRETFLKVLAEYIENGGRVLYPLPVPMLYTKEGATSL